MVAQHGLGEGPDARVLALDQGDVRGQFQSGRFETSPEAKSGGEGGMTVSARAPPPPSANASTRRRATRPSATRTFRPSRAASWLALSVAGVEDVAGGVASVVFGHSDIDAGEFCRLARPPHGRRLPEGDDLALESTARDLKLPPARALAR
jgi:hypothetical protein